MTLYEDLGVTPSATPAEIRRAYLDLARAHHPDRSMAKSAEVQRIAGETMSRVNRAWHVLGDVERRADYDAERFGASSSGRSSRVRTPDDTWSPYNTSEEEIDPRLLDDTPSGAPTLGRAVTMAPMAMFASGFATLGFGLFMALTPFMVLGLGLLVASAASFVLIPVLAMINSSRGELD